MMNKYELAIREYLKSKDKEVKPEYELMLKTLSDTIDEYEKCREVIEKIGVYDYESGKRNPLLNTVKELRTLIYKYSKSFGLSPYDVGKLKVIKDDDTDDLIDELCS